MTLEEIRTKRKELGKKIKELQLQIDHVIIDLKHLRLDCSHPNKYSSNTWGRDPGGAECPDCGKSW